MTLEYTITVDDWVATTILIQGTLRQRTRLLPRAIKIATGVVFYAFFLYFFATVDSLPARVAACAVMLSLGIAGHKSVRESLMEQWLHDHYALSGNDLLFGRRIITTSEAGFTIRGEQFAAQYPWSSIYSLQETPDYILVYIARVQAHPIPRRTVTDQAAIPALVAEFRSHLPEGQASAA